MRLLALLLCVVALPLASCAQDDEPPQRAGEASADAPDGPFASEGVDGVIEVEADGREHVAGHVDYDTYPPAGGNHFPVWQNCGFYDEPVTDELAVHSLEHGAVWIAYQEAVPAAELDQLEARVEQESFVLAAPYPGLRAPIVLTAWGRQLDLQSVDDVRFQVFLDTYLKGPTTPEPDAPCSGGIDSTAD